MTEGARGLSTRTEEADEKVMTVAARLFSELGYDVTTLGMIEDAVGTEGEGSELLHQGKRQVYYRILARYHALETDRLRSVMREAPEGAEGVHRLVDAFFDFVVDYPEVSALWQQRGLQDAADLRFPEEEFPPPLLAMMDGHPWQGLPSDLDLDFVGWMVLWTVGGYIHNSRYIRGPAIPRFRARLHEVLDRLL